MKVRIAICLLAAALLWSLLAGPGAAQEPARTAAEPTKIAVVDARTVFSDMQETQDFKKKMDDQVRQFKADMDRRGQELNAKKSALDLIKPDSAQYQQLSKDYFAAALEMKNWQDMSNMELEHTQKVQMKALFDKIEAGAAELAAQRGYDLVLASQHSDIDPEKMNIAEVQARLSQRNVLYAAPRVDLTNDLLALLDARYKNAAGTAPAH